MEKSKNPKESMSLTEKEKKLKKDTKSKISENKNEDEKKKGIFSKITDKLDANGDGKVDLKDFVLMAVKVPGVSINRRDFLKKELGKKTEEKKVMIALDKNPKFAKIENATIEYIADDVIESERKKVVAVSAALGVPGVIAATLPADIAQYFSFMLRAAQKLMYLYGYPELEVNENINDDTVNVLAIALGTMLGVQGADAALRGLSKGILDSISSGIKISIKSITAFLGSAGGKIGIKILGLSIPVLGGVISGGLTHVMFTKGCERLRKELRNGPLNDENSYIEK